MVGEEEEGFVEKERHLLAQSKLLRNAVLKLSNRATLSSFVIL